MPFPIFKQLLFYLFVFAATVSPVFLFRNPDSRLFLFQSHEAFYAIPFIGLFVFAFLGSKLNQVKLIIFSILLLLAFVLLSHPLGIPIDLSQRAKVLSIALPLSFSITILYDEDRFLSLGMLARTLFSLSPIVVGLLVAYAIATQSFQLPFVIEDFIAGPIARQWHLPDFVLILIILFIIAAGIPEDGLGAEFRRILILVLIPIYLVFNKIALTGQNQLSPHPASQAFVSVSFSIASVLLLYALFRVYWKRVYVDQLTEIPNRRALDEALKSHRKNYCLAMVDIDHFKKFNDTYGHEEGDNVLRYVAKHMERESKRRAYRYGGEEFSLLFPKTEIREAYDVANSIRKSLSQKSFYLRINPTRRGHKMGAKLTSKKEPKRKVRITISIGIAKWRDGEKPEQILRRADHALYEAKERGRNRTVMAQ